MRELSGLHCFLNILYDPERKSVFRRSFRSYGGIYSLEIQLLDSEGIYLSENCASKYFKQDRTREHVCEREVE